MPDDTLIKQVVFGIIHRWQEQERKTEKKMDGRPSGLVQQGYQHPVQIGDGRGEMDPFREICH